MGNTCSQHASQESVRSGADGDVEMSEKRVDKSQNERGKSRHWLRRLSAWCCGGKTDDAVEIGKRGFHLKLHLCYALPVNTVKVSG